MSIFATFMAKDIALHRLVYRNMHSFISLQDNDGSALVTIEVGTNKLIVISFKDFNPKESDPGNGIVAYHRKATEVDKTILDCIIPNFKTEDAYIFTWINATASTGAYVS